jgi:membrane-associated phospholipid phosphatase
MRGRRLRAYDRRLHTWIGALPASPADRWLRRLSVLADHGKLWFGLAGVLSLFGGRWRRAAIRGVAAQGLSSLVTNTVLKQQFGRVRPDIANFRSDRKLRRELGTLSFPSGHSSSAGAFVTGVALEAPAAGLALAPLALGVGYSRVHVGVHYPGDVLAGLAIGTGVALAGRRIARRPRPAPDGDDLWTAPVPPPSTGDVSPGAPAA